MARKTEYTKEQIIDEAYALVREKGISYLSARNLAQRIGCSVKPLFTSFENMDDIKKEVAKKAQNFYEAFVTTNLPEEHFFYHAGLRLIELSIKETNLFKFLFMGESNKGLDILTIIDVKSQNLSRITSQLKSHYQIDEEKAIGLFNHMWVFVYGIAVGCATGYMVFDEKNIKKMMFDQFEGVYISIVQGMKRA